MSPRIPLPVFIPSQHTSSHRLQLHTRKQTGTGVGRAVSRVILSIELAYIPLTEAFALFQCFAIPGLPKFMRRYNKQSFGLGLGLGVLLLCVLARPPSRPSLWSFEQSGGVSGRALRLSTCASCLGVFNLSSKSQLATSCPIVIPQLRKRIAHRRVHNNGNASPLESLPVRQRHSRR